MQNRTPDYDVIIIGAGPAGLTAGIYVLRRGLKTLILEGKMPGGRIVEAHLVENYPGFTDPPSGTELATKMVQQLEKFGGTINRNEAAVSFSLHGETKTVTTRRAMYTAKAVIIAIGVQRRRLFIPGEKELLGRGVSYCATCDAPFFKGMEVVVVGSGNEALEEARYLADMASKVYLVPNDVKFSAAKSLIKAFDGKENTQILKNQKVQAINGTQVVESIQLQDLVQATTKELPCNGVFIAVGVVPTTEMVKAAGVEVDAKGWVKVDRAQRTNLDGVFAAGDCTGTGWQVATAVGEGAMAALSTSRHIK
jgi:thioredoxin reductase (NADPH)